MRVMSGNSSSTIVGNVMRLRPTLSREMAIVTFSLGNFDFLRQRPSQEPTAWGSFVSISSGTGSTNTRLMDNVLRPRAARSARSRRRPISIAITFRAGIIVSYPLWSAAESVYLQQASGSQ